MKTHGKLWESREKQKIDTAKFNLLPNERLESFWDALWLGIRTFLYFKMSNWSHFGATLAHFGATLGHSGVTWEPLGSHFGTLGRHFGALWRHFRVSLGPYWDDFGTPVSYTHLTLPTICSV